MLMLKLKIQKSRRNNNNNNNQNNDDDFDLVYELFYILYNNMILIYLLSLNFIIYLF